MIKPKWPKMPRNRRLIIKIRFILPIYSVAERLINLSIVIIRSSFLKRIIYEEFLYEEGNILFHFVQWEVNWSGNLYWPTGIGIFSCFHGQVKCARHISLLFLSFRTSIYFLLPLSWPINITQELSPLIKNKT